MHGIDTKALQLLWDENDLFRREMIAQIIHTAKGYISHSRQLYTLTKKLISGSNEPDYRYHFSVGTTPPASEIQIVKDSMLTLTNNRYYQQDDHIYIGNCIPMSHKTSASVNVHLGIYRADVRDREVFSYNLIKELLQYKPAAFVIEHTLNKQNVDPVEYLTRLNSKALCVFWDQKYPGVMQRVYTRSFLIDPKRSDIPVTLGGILDTGGWNGPETNVVLYKDWKKYLKNK